MSRILVIDDEQTVRAAVEQVLKTKGHTILQAENGSEALKLFSDGGADLIITDMFMPEQDGVGVMVSFRRIDAKIPIIAISGNPKGDTLAIAKQLGAVAVLEKPFSLNDLLETVEAALKA
jgi:DNA-binding NtrC family response regulator